MNTPINHNLASMATDPQRSAFTLIELLVSVAIIAIVLSISFPFIRALARDTDVATGVNAAAMGGTVAQAYATKESFVWQSSAIDLMQVPPFPIGNTSPDPGLYSGVAAIFTPANEIRITRNIATAYDTSATPEPLERKPDAATAAQPGIEPLSKHLNGFTDILVDYITLPGDAGVAGITRTAAGGEPLLIAPPFALWFSPSGTLMVGPDDHEHVYYDAAPRNGRYDVLNDRPAGYNPDLWDPQSGQYDPTNWDSTASRYGMPFEKIETIIGVLVYSKREFRSAGLNWTGGSTNTELWDWLRENGKLVMFSQQTGLALRGTTDQ